MVIEMYFAVNFSWLNYTYTISFAVHFRIINVAVPMSVFGLTLPSPPLRAPLPLAALISGGPAGGKELTPQRAAVGRRSGVGRCRLGFQEELAGGRPSLVFSVIGKGLRWLAQPAQLPRN